MERGRGFDYIFIVTNRLVQINKFHVFTVDNFFIVDNIIVLFDFLYCFLEWCIIYSYVLYIWILTSDLFKAIYF